MVELFKKIDILTYNIKRITESEASRNRRTHGCKKNYNNLV